MRLKQRSICMPGQCSPSVPKHWDSLPALLATTVMLLSAGSSYADAPVAIVSDSSTFAKMSPDLVAELKADPDSGLSPSISASSASAHGGASNSARRHAVLIRVTKSDASLPVATNYFSSVHIHRVYVTAKQLLSLQSKANVRSISVDRPVTATDDPSGGDESNLPLDVNPRTVGADVASSQVSSVPMTGILASGIPLLNGRGVTVAVLDSGVAPVNDLKSRLVGFADMVHGAQAPYDDYGHGTHVAGIIAGDGTDSSSAIGTKQYKGIAPGANIVGVKVLDEKGGGSQSNVIAGIDWCIANKKKFNISVINMSLTGPVLESYKTDPVCQAVEAAVQAGITVVVSAGNKGGTYGYIGSPANDPNVITVGCSNSMQTADRSDDVITTYTSRGPTMVDGNFKPDLVAPGNKVVSLRAPGSTIDLTNPYGYVSPSEYLSGDTSSLGSSYTRLSGTSMSAPAVAGAVALMLQQNGALKPNGVKLALMYSAQLLKGYDPVLKATVTYDPMTQGAGELNVPGAVQLASLMFRGGLRAEPTKATAFGGSAFDWSPITLRGAITVKAVGATCALGSDVPVVVTSTWWTDPTLWSNPALWDSTSLTWGGSANNLTWSGGGFDLNLLLTWAAGGDNLTWSGGGFDNPSNSLTWNGGAENLTWSGGGFDINLSLSWGAGGDSVTVGGDGD